MPHYENLQLYLRIALKLQKYIYWIKHKKRVEAEQNRNKYGKGLYKLMNKAIYGKAMKILRNRIDVRLVNNEKEYLKCRSKSSYVSHKIFGNNLVELQKSKVALKLKKPVYIRMCILEFSKILMY